MRDNQANFYLILNVSPRAPDREIKKAYLRLAKIYHPDKNRGNRLAEEKFRQINKAWQILKDPAQRKLFDESLKKAKEKSRAKAPPPPPKEKPVDLEFPLRLSLEDICQGRAKTLRYFRPVAGKREKSFLDLKIPPSARPGAKLFFRGGGGAEGKKAFGDLYVRLELKPHKLFHQLTNSADLALERPISFISAIRGEKIEIPSPYGGFLFLDLKPPVKNRQLFRLKGQGLAKSAKGEKGDLFVKILIDWPLKKTNLKQRMENMPFEKQKVYVEKFKSASFVYPKVLKFLKKARELGK